MKRWAREILCFFFRIACERPIRYDLADDVAAILASHTRAWQAIERADVLIEREARRGGRR